MTFLRDYFILWAELGALIVGLAVSLIVPDFGSSILSPFRSLLLWSSRRPSTAVAFAILIAPLLRLLAWPWVKLPYPAIHDEYSYLLLADTLASGRLTNLPHPFWIHFEAMHVLQQPTYASTYPVMQGVFIAIGEAVVRAPWLGVWLSMSLFCGALYWMLKAWLPHFWSLAGTVLVAIRFGIFSYWMNSYWGGAPGALGGALVLGALPRIFRYCRIRDACWLALGMAILANSRPYEGFFFCLPVAFVFFAWLFGSDKTCHWLGFQPCPSGRGTRLRLLVPIALILVVTGAGMNYYFWRVTGNAFKMPNSLEAEQYGITPLFIWQKLRPEPHYNTDTLRYFFTQIAARKTSQAERFFDYWRIYLGPALTFPLLLGVAAFRDRRVRFLLAVILAVLVAVAIEWWARPHYAAPMTGALFAMVLQSLRHMRVTFMRDSGASSRWRGLVALAPVVVLLMIPAQLVLPRIPIEQTIDILFGAPTLYRQASPRLQIEQFLMKQGPKHLILVRYTNHENDFRIHDEWVYNSANIDQQPIVWARELDEERNRKLREYYKDRRIWLCSPDESMLVPWD